MSTVTKLDESERIKVLNDSFRKNWSTGRVMFTANVAALPEEVRLTAVKLVMEFDEFTENNDPYGEHDFGSFDLVEAKCFWKIDYYDLNYQYGSNDPTDPSVTRRVLTIGFMSDY